MKINLHENASSIQRPISQMTWKISHKLFSLSTFFVIRAAPILSAKISVHRIYTVHPSV